MYGCPSREHANRPNRSRLRHSRLALFVNSLMSIAPIHLRDTLDVGGFAQKEHVYLRASLVACIYLDPSVNLLGSDSMILRPIPVPVRVRKSGGKPGPSSVTDTRHILSSS